MASYVNMSLEDIIQRKRRENTKDKRKLKGNRLKPDMPTSKPVPITDARNKIILKKRTQISDAREKLAELAKHKDARLKLELLRKKRAMLQPQQGRNTYTSYGKLVRRVPNKERVFIDQSRQVVSQQLSQSRMPVRHQPMRHQPARHQLNTNKFTENRSVEARTFDKIPKLKPIIRTVENDIDVVDDPMGEEDYEPPRPSSLNRKANLQLRIIARNNEVRESRLPASHRLATPEREKSPPRPPSILKKRPMAALRNEKKTEKPVLEYRIIVSNLRNTVTGGDIEELFGDVGGMLESRLVRPGTAEVIYKTVEDAQKAVELYHNRQLDGQPMTCLLVTPRAPVTTSKTGSKPALVSSNSNVEPDISTFHKVLFSNF